MNAAHSSAHQPGSYLQLRESIVRIDNLTGLANVPSIFQSGAGSPLSNMSANILPSIYSSPYIVTFSDSAQAAIAAPQVGGADWLVSYGFITPDEERGLQFCTTLVSYSCTSSSTVSASFSQQSTQVTTKDGGTVSTVNDQLNVQAASNQQQAWIYEDHILTADGHPIDLMYEDVVESDGKRYSIMLLQNLNPAGVVQNLRQAIDRGEITGNDIVAASRQNYNTALQLLTSVAQASFTSDQAQTSSLTISLNHIVQTAPGAAGGAAEKDVPTAPSQAATTATDSGLQQADTLFKLFDTLATPGRTVT
jgi:hypothetical protein